MTAKTAIAVFTLLSLILAAMPILCTLEYLNAHGKFPYSKPRPTLPTFHIPGRPATIASNGEIEMQFVRRPQQERSIKIEQPPQAKPKQRISPTVHSFQAEIITPKLAKPVEFPPRTQIRGEIPRSDSQSRRKSSEDRMRNEYHPPRKDWR
jgi:hypothetical protein